MVSQSHYMGVFILFHFIYYFPVLIALFIYLFNCLFLLYFIIKYSLFPHTTLSHNYMNCYKDAQLLQRCTSSPSNKYTGALRVHTGDSYATRAITKAHKFTRHSAPGHNGPNEPRSVNRRGIVKIWLFVHYYVKKTRRRSSQSCFLNSFTIVDRWAWQRFELIKCLFNGAYSGL